MQLRVVLEGLANLAVHNQRGLVQVVGRDDDLTVRLSGEAEP